MPAPKIIWWRARGIGLFSRFQAGLLVDTLEVRPAEVTPSFVCGDHLAVVLFLRQLVLVVHVPGNAEQDNETDDESRLLSLVHSSTPHSEPDTPGNDESTP